MLRTSFISHRNDPLASLEPLLIAVKYAKPLSLKWLLSEPVMLNWNARDIKRLFENIMAV